MLRGIKHLFSAKGRAGRMEYFIHSFSESIIILLGAVVFSPSNGDGGQIEEVLNAVNRVIYSAAILGGIIAKVCVTIRRLHDLGRSGMNGFGLLVPFYNIYLGLILLFQEGQPGDNEYGESLWKP